MKSNPHSMSNNKKWGHPWLALLECLRPPRRIYIKKPKRHLHNREPISSSEFFFFFFLERPQPPYLKACASSICHRVSNACEPKKHLNVIFGALAGPRSRNIYSDRIILVNHCLTHSHLSLLHLCMASTGKDDSVYNSQKVRVSELLVWCLHNTRLRLKKITRIIKDICRQHRRLWDFGGCGLGTLSFNYFRLVRSLHQTCEANHRPMVPVHHLSFSCENRTPPANELDIS
jgi:hypothetical protein